MMVFVCRFITHTHSQRVSVLHNKYAYYASVAILLFFSFLRFFLLSFSFLLQLRLWWIQVGVIVVSLCIAIISCVHSHHSLLYYSNFLLLLFLDITSVSVVVVFSLPSMLLCRLLLLMLAAAIAPCCITCANVRNIVILGSNSWLTCLLARQKFATVFHLWKQCDTYFFSVIMMMMPLLLVTVAVVLLLPPRCHQSCLAQAHTTHTNFKRRSLWIPLLFNSLENEFPVQSIQSNTTQHSPIPCHTVCVLSLISVL